MGYIQRCVWFLKHKVVLFSHSSWQRLESPIHLSFKVLLRLEDKFSVVFPRMSGGSFSAVERVCECALCKNVMRRLQQRLRRYSVQTGNRMPVTCISLSCSKPSSRIIKNSEISCKNYFDYLLRCEDTFYTVHNRL